jgi:hypothetical protein
MHTVCAPSWDKSLDVWRRVQVRTSYEIYDARCVVTFLKVRLDESCESIRQCLRDLRHIAHGYRLLYHKSLAMLGSRFGRRTYPAHAHAYVMSSEMIQVELKTVVFFPN